MTSRRQAHRSFWNELTITLILPRGRRISEPAASLERPGKATNWWVLFSAMIPSTQSRPQESAGPEGYFRRRDHPGSLHQIRTVTAGIPVAQLDCFII